ncbi:uncharacterized protein RCO7_15015 [Rhynchosporium graminicola]|uniref:Uncharacterized protein n=1 Tax=Rhynchosporium graminicola TaxID=2792576 RepID=A0A1E1LFB2_9HELO|nr:uncharacterized protein RCO7_15015 [Rhynchosporium commune]
MRALDRPNEPHDRCESVMRKDISSSPTLLRFSIEDFGRSRHGTLDGTPEKAAQPRRTLDSKRGWIIECLLLKARQPALILGYMIQ